MKRVIGIAVALSVALVLLATPVLAAHDVVLCRVDIGVPSSEAGHDLIGWGPVEPDEHGGSWGGIAPDNCRVIWDATDDDPSAMITLDRCLKHGAAKAIRVSHLDGIADDSFDIYVKDVHDDWVEVGSYTDESPINDPENWVVAEFALPNGKTLQLDRGRAVEVKLVATGLEWSGFDTYGQVAFDWIELVGNGKK